MQFQSFTEAMISIILPAILLINFCAPAFMTYCEIMSVLSPRYELMKYRVRSQNKILIRRQIPTFDECLAFTVAKKGLAFNYSRDLRNKHSSEIDINRFNCQVLACPEVDSSGSLVEDKKFNYYSSYPRKLMLGNRTAVCVPTIGLFVHIEKPDNYTSAQLTCAKFEGKLANIMSAERTAGLSPFLYSENPVYVGLSNRGEERYWRNEFGNKLECSDDRRWAEGEPSSRGCVALIRANFHGNNHTFWKVFPCHRKFSFICEISPRYEPDLFLNKLQATIHIKAKKNLFH